MPTAEPEYSFVLPAHNEIGLLGSTITNLVTGLDSRGIRYEILVVENGSADGTLRLARLLAAQIEAIRVLTLPRGNYGAALRAGFRAACGEIVVNFDVDYYDLGFFDAAVELFERDGVDIVLASKRAPDARDRRPLPRRVLTFGFSTILRSVIALPVSDAHGMKAMRRGTIAPFVDLCQLRGSIYDVELIARAAQRGAKIAELPATVAERRPPRSSVSLRIAEAIWSVGRLWALLRKEQRSASRRAISDGPSEPSASR